MLRKPWILNLLLVAGLVVVAARLWSLWQEPLPELPGSAPAAKSQAAPEPESGEETEATPADYEVIATKDLFSPARGVAPPVTPQSAAGLIPPKPVPTPKVTLAGVVILDGEKSAFLQEGTQDARPRKVREGESFAGGKLTAIRPDGVTLLFPSGEVAVPLRTPKDSGPGLPGGVASPPGRFGQPVRGGPGIPGQTPPQQLQPKPPAPGVPAYVPPEDEEPPPDEELYEEEGMEEGLEEEFEDGENAEEFEDGDLEEQ